MERCGDWWCVKLGKEKKEMVAHYDYVVAGSGLAGLYVALRAAKYGTVALLTKSWVRESNSYYAQGGIAAVTDKDDRPSLHYADTIEAGRGLCDSPAVEVLVNEAPQRIEELINAGMHFDQNEGVLALGLEGGHHQRRILHAGGDSTGAMVTSFLADKVARESRISIFENHSVLELLIKAGACWGIRAWNAIEQHEAIFVGRHTFLTLGGASALYKRTTNPGTTIGDGVATAWRAGCEIVDLEFIQFHPTALYNPNGPAFLVSEAVRGEGAYLINTKGERFMMGKYPLAELSPRDVVAQAIYREIQKQEEPYVWLDLQHLNPQRILERFPMISRRCREVGFDLTKRVPIAPAAHYMVGGVNTDLYGQTKIHNLYVCGELAHTGIMGANRLASNSLIECLVFGHRAVEQTHLAPHSEVPDAFEPHFTLDASRSAAYTTMRNELADVLQNNVGIVRNEALLTSALAWVDAMAQRIPDDRTEFFAHQMMNLVIVSRLLINGALFRKESRGGHYREDFPVTRPEFECHTVQQAERSIERVPVVKLGEPLE